MDFDDEIINYLTLHGEKKESDLIEFCTKNLHLSSKVAKERLDRLIKKGWIKRIIHPKLGTPVVYVAFKEPDLNDLMQFAHALLGTNPLNPEGKDQEALHEETRAKILEDARTVAEQRMKQKSSG